jgi:SAM-dependent methyltransferase
VTVPAESANAPCKHAETAQAPGAAATGGTRRITKPITRGLPAPEVVARNLRGGRGVSDREFDQVYNLHQRWVSSRQWTPVTIATRAAALLAAGGRRLVLDIGSGVGKFCITGALTTKALFMGVEQRPHLVKSARSAAARFRTSRAVFFEGDFTQVDFTLFDGFYLFNPFEEHLQNGVVTPIDNTLTLSRGRFRRHFVSLLRKLRTARSGTRVLTYYGHGGPMAQGYRIIRSEPAGADRLILWEKG